MITISRVDEVVRQAGRGVLHAARGARGAGVESFHGHVVDGVFLRLPAVGFTFSLGRSGRGGGAI